MLKTIHTSTKLDQVIPSKETTTTVGHIEVGNPSMHLIINIIETLQIKVMLDQIKVMVDMEVSKNGIITVIILADNLEEEILQHDALFANP